MTMNRFNSFRLGSFALLALAAAGAQAETIYGLSAANSLVSFDSANPSGFTTIGAMSGVVSGQTLRAIDFRPASGTLYALSSSSSSTGGLAQLYTVNLATGALTTVGAGFAISTTSTRVSIDFNPVVDRLRVITGDGDNYRVNPITGALAATDTSLAFAPGDVNEGFDDDIIADVAYTNNVAGATSTTLYGYDFDSDELVRIGSPGGTPISPNSGQMFTVGGSGGPSEFDGAVGFDISGVTGTGYISFDDGPSASAFEEIYSVNLATGTLTLIDDEIGVNLIDISVAAAPVPEPASMIALGAGALALLRRRRR